LIALFFASFSFGDDEVPRDTVLCDEVCTDTWTLTVASALNCLSVRGRWTWL
jgi:hypothetical protein